MSALLTIAETARELGVSKKTVERLIARQELRACRFAGRIVRVPLDAIGEFIACNTGSPGPSSTESQAGHGTSAGPNVAALVVSLQGRQTGD